MEKNFIDSVYNAGVDLKGMMKKTDSMLLLATSDDCDSFACAIQGNGRQIAILLHNAAEMGENFKNALLAVAEQLSNKQNK